MLKLLQKHEATSLLKIRNLWILKILRAGKKSDEKFKFFPFFMRKKEWKNELIAICEILEKNIFLNFHYNKTIVEACNEHRP